MGMAEGADLGMRISEKKPPSPCLFGNGTSASDNQSSRWSDEMLELMLGHVVSLRQRKQRTLDLLGSFSSLHHKPLQHPLPCGWDRCLDLQAGTFYYVNSKTGTRTSTHPLALLANGLNSPQLSSSTVNVCPDMNSLDLDLRLASPPQNPTTSSFSASSPSHDSKGSFQAAYDDGFEKLISGKAFGDEEEGYADMVALGCRKCLMYVMLSSADPRCPSCGASSFLDIPQSKRSKLAHTTI